MDRCNVQDPRIYTEEEIEIFLHGDRCEIDKLILTSTNSIARAFITFRDIEFRPHVEQEQSIFVSLGSLSEIERRRIWLDQQISKEIDRAILRKKIIESSVLWAIPLLLSAFLIIMQTGFRTKILEWLNVNPVEQSTKVK